MEGIGKQTSESDTFSGALKSAGGGVGSSLGSAVLVLR